MPERPLETSLTSPPGNPNNPFFFLIVSGYNIDFCPTLLSAPLPAFSFCSHQCQFSEIPAWHSWNSVATAGSQKCPRWWTNAPILSASVLTLKPYLAGTVQSKTNQWNQAGIWSGEANMRKKKDDCANRVWLSREEVCKAIPNHQHLSRVAIGGPGKACQHLC